MKRSFCLILLLSAVIAIHVEATQQAPAPAGQQPPAAPAAGQRGTPGSENGIAIFQTQCMGCHGNAKSPRASLPGAIREMTPERIQDSLTMPAVKDHAPLMLSDVDKRLVAEFMGSRPL